MARRELPGAPALVERVDRTVLVNSLSIKTRRIIMCFIVIEVAVIAAHLLAAFATGIFKLDFITAQRKISAIAAPVMLIVEWHYLSPPQPVPLKTIEGALKTRAIGYEQHNGELSP